MPYDYRDLDTLGLLWAFLGRFQSVSSGPACNRLYSESSGRE
jgi:hypothetical protein